jgi:hypothetical protein
MPRGGKLRKKDERRRRASVRFDEPFPFGPAFFVHHLGRFVRDRCPDPAESLPVLELGLSDGRTLDVCHVIGLAPTWVALATYEPGRPPSARAMQTELVPYACIVHVTIRAGRRESAHVGFMQQEAPPLVPDAPRLTPEAMLRSAAPPARALPPPRPSPSRGKGR